MRLDASELAKLPPEMQRQILKQLEEEGGAKRRGHERPLKYRNTPTERNGIKFDSQKEANRYDELYIEKAAGLISDLRLQHEFTLVEAHTTLEGERVRAVRYRADFTYYRDGVFVIEDVKSSATRTKDYVIKRKLMRDRLGLTITEV